MARKKQRMSFRDACDLVPDDLPDGAFWAMAHEMAGIEDGDGFDELIQEAEMMPVGVEHRPLPKGAPNSRKPYECECGRRFRNINAASQHRRDVHDAALAAKE